MWSPRDELQVHAGCEHGVVLETRALVQNPLPESRWKAAELLQVALVRTLNPKP